MPITREQAQLETKVRIPETKYGRKYTLPQLEVARQRGQNFLYIVENEQPDEIGLYVDVSLTQADYFHIDDLELYVEEEFMFQKEDPFQQIQHTITGLTDLLRYKNQKYGNTNLSNGGVFSQQTNLEKLYARADDKIARIKNRAVDTEPSLNDVSDLAGYCILILTAQGKQDFTDQMD